MQRFDASSEELLSRFPKSRIELPEAYRKIFVAHYVMNREGTSAATSVAKKLESWMHRMVAADVANRKADYTTLEIGAGGLNHLPYEPASTPYDVVEPFEELQANSPFRSRISNFHRDLAEIQNKRYDRIISIAAFEHLCDLPSVVARCGTLLRSGGELRVAIPSEGTLLWMLGWKLTTGIEFRLRHGLDYGVLMRHEHVNAAEEIFEVVRLFFRRVTRKVFGICPSLSLYQFLRCTEPDIDRCTIYAGSQSSPPKLV